MAREGDRRPFLDSVDPAWFPYFGWLIEELRDARRAGALRIRVRPDDAHSDRLHFEGIRESACVRLGWVCRRALFAPDVGGSIATLVELHHARARLVALEDERRELIDRHGLAS
jgi:hypothetical protein